MMGLSLKLLGEFAVRDASGAALSLPTRKTRALLGYLAVNADRPQPRERLMALLWSDRGERQARQSLNQALLLIRKLDSASVLLDSDGERVTLRGDAVECDVGRFRSLLKDDPAEAAALYQGPFLDGLSVPDPGFEDWLLATRSELHALACDALERAAEATEDTKAAIDCARRLVALDPLREAARRRLMRLLHASGDRAGALRQYQACVDVLKKELQVEPDAATRSLFAEIRRDAGKETRPILRTREWDTPSLPDKPSIAVLPFDNIGDDPVADHLADGLTEDLTAALAKVPELFVAARNSAFTYKGMAVNVPEVAKALGVRYVLEGSVQKSGDRLRVTPQLIDAVNGHHLWAERYDRPIEDVFALQDEIVRRVVIELQVKLTEGYSARIASRGTKNLDAWLYWVQARAEIRRHTPEHNVRARELSEAAHRADPNWALPLAGLARCKNHEARYGWSASREDSIARGIEYAEQAVAMDPEEPLGYQALWGLNTLLGNHEKAFSYIEKAESLAPNDLSAVGMLAIQLTYMDEADRAVEVFERAVRLGPIVQQGYQRVFGIALQLVGRTDRAVAVLEKLAREEPEWTLGLAQLAAAYAGADRFDAAQETTRRILERDPRFTASRYLALVPFQYAKHTEWLRSLLLKAGLPEGDGNRTESAGDPAAAIGPLSKAAMSDGSSGVTQVVTSSPPEILPSNTPLPVLDKPSIAILPFDNLGVDPAQDFFGDGIAEDIITELSRFRSLFVIARGSSFSFKGQSLDTGDVAAKLGVRYVLEGSVRAHGPHIRVTAQLIDAENDHHIWSEHYDRDTKDIFAVQDEITRRIVGIIEPEIVLSEQTKAERLAPDQFEVWGLYQQAVSRYYRMTQKDRSAGVALLRKAISKDPGFAPAHAYLAICIQNGVTFGDYDNADAALSEALRAARESVRLDARDALSSYALGRVFTGLGKLHNSHLHLATATDHMRAAIDLNPNFALAYYGLGNNLYFLNRPAEAIRNIEIAIRLNPYAPNVWAMCKGQALSYVSLNQDRLALEWAQKAMQQPNAHPRFNAALAAIAARLGETDQARAAVMELRRRLSVTEIDQAVSVVLRLYSPKKKFKEGLRKAGLLEL